MTRAAVPLAAACGALAALGQVPWSFWPLGVLGLAAALALAARDRARAGRIGWAFFAAHHAVALQWVREPFAVDPVIPDALGWLALGALAGGLALLPALALRLAAGWRRAPFLPAAAALLLGAEVARMHLFGGFPWAAPGQALIDSPLLGLASLGGPHLMDAAVIGMAAGLAGLVQGAARGRMLAAGPMLGALAAAVLPAVGLVWWLARPATEDRPEEWPADPMVRLVQPDADQLLKWQPEMAAAFTRRLLTLSEGEGADLVVWPETALPYLLGEAAVVLERARAAAGAPVIVGANRWDGTAAHNAAALIGPGGSVDALYDKHHLVPFGEYVPLRGLAARLGLQGLADVLGGGFAPGPGPALIEVPGVGPVLPLICYESVFPRSLRVEGRARAIVLITNDEWFGTGPGPAQHLAQARLRAAESGLPVARAANSGITAMIDGTGRVVAALPPGAPGALQAVLPPSRAPTPYARTGDVPVWAGLALALGILALRGPGARAIDRPSGAA